MTVIMRKPRVSTDLFSFTKVFNWKIWLTVGILTIGIGILVFIFERISPFSSINTKSDIVRNSQIKYNLKESIWLSLGSLTIAGAEFPPHTISTRVLLSGFWVFSVILISTYQANLAAYLTISRLDTSITSLQDLANQQKVKYSLVTGTTVQTYFEEMTNIEGNFYDFWKSSSLLTARPDEDCSSVTNNDCKFKYLLQSYIDESSIFGALEYKSLWEYPLSNTFTTLLKRIKSVGYLNNTRDGIDRIMNAPDDSPFALISEYPIALYETNLNCELQLIGNQFSNRPYSMALRKTSSDLTANISSVLLALQGNLVFDELKTKWWGSAKCTDASESGETIRLTSIGGAFIFVAGALSLSFIILLIDLINKRVKRLTKSNKYKSQQNGNGRAIH